MNPGNTDPTADDDMEFVAPDDRGWHYTILRDWISVCPDISPTAARLYWIVRSIMHEKGEKKRRLSIDQLCYLLPGINGKPTSETRVKDSIRELEGIQLLSNPDGDVVRRWVTNPKTGRQTRENFRRWQIHDFPPNRDNSTVWRSAIAKLDAYPGPGWRSEMEKSQVKAEGRKNDSQGTGEGRKNDPQSTGKSSTSGNTKKSQVGTEGRKTASSRRKSDQFRRKTGDFDAVTSENEGPKESFQGSSVSKKNPPTPHGGEETDLFGGVLAADDDPEPTGKATAPPADEGFDEFWAVYPRKAAKDDARKAWKRSVKEHQATFLIEQARRWADLWSRADKAKTYLPYPATWLNGRRWRDEEPELPESAGPGAPRRRSSAGEDVSAYEALWSSARA